MEVLSGNTSIVPSNSVYQQIDNALTGFYDNNVFTNKESDFQIYLEMAKQYAEEKLQGSLTETHRKMDSLTGDDYEPGKHSIEIGYSISRSFWGNGYGKCAVAGVLEFLRTETETKMVRAWSRKENMASIKILTGAGFVETEQKDDQIIYELKL